MVPTPIFLINLTGKTISLLSEACPDLINPANADSYLVQKLLASGPPARMERAAAATLDAIEPVVLPTGQMFRVFIPEPRITVGLPVYSRAMMLAGTRYLVTAVVGAANKDRDDLLVVSRLVRDVRQSMVVVGARALSRVP